MMATMTARLLYTELYHRETSTVTPADMQQRRMLTDHALTIAFIKI